MGDFDDDEPDTKPDLELFPCPACKDERGRPSGIVTVWSGTHHRTRTCEVCKGKLRITRDRLHWFRSSRGRGEH